jgi:protein-L-isoaspartate(D-aspartate) O-methyltransferase
LASEETWPPRRLGFRGDLASEETWNLRSPVLRFGGACTKDGGAPVHFRGARFPRLLLTGSPMSGFATARQKMVDGQVRTNDVTDTRILDAMLALPRELFVPESLRALAYLDLDLDVSEAGAAKRYMIKPQVIAKLLQAAEIAATDRVLVVGSATGYAAALASRLAAKVTATESESALVAKGKEILAQLGFANVAVKAAAPAEGDPADAPYDVIVLNGATEVVPDRLFDQLAEGGRLVGVFAASSPARATIVTKSHGDLGHRVLFDAAAPVLPGMERVPSFVF